MPFYKISIQLERTEQNDSGRAITVVREFKETELDKVWHLLNVKCEGKWGRKLYSFDCVRISKRSPDYIKYIRTLQQKKYNRYDDLLSDKHIAQPKKKIPENKIQSVNRKYRNQND